jgi:GNAT superfamily N-acetyltransferase
VLRTYEALEGSYLDDSYRAELRDLATRVAVAEVTVAVADDGRYLGCVTYAGEVGNPYHEFADPDAATFRMLAVDPAVEGHGVGRALLEWCIERAREQKKARLLIYTGTVMNRAHAIYERRGFVRRPDLDWRPEPHLLLLAYGLELEAAD